MKKLSILASLFVLAAAFTSCEKNVNPANPAEEINYVEVIAKTPAETRTTLDEYQQGGKTFYAIKWEDGDLLRVTYGDIANNKINGTAVGSKFNSINADKTEATFWLIEKEGEHNIYVLYPEAASRSQNATVNTKLDKVFAQVKTEQVGRENGPDADASLMFSKFKYSGTAGNAKTIECVFNHLVAYGKITFTALPEDVENAKISSVKFVAEDGVALTGTDYVYDVATDTFATCSSEDDFRLESGTLIVSTPLNYVSVAYENGLDNKNSVWFAVAPNADGYSTLSVEVAFENSLTYKKTLAPATPITFSKGKVSNLNIDLKNGSESL